MARDETTAGGVTRALAGRIVALRGDAVPEEARIWARHCLTDWIAVTVAGRDEPIVRALRGLAAEGPLPLLASGRHAALRDAVLVNGAAGHALDYDDVNAEMRGHPTVPLAPVVLALGAVQGTPGRAVLEAFVAGYEAACLIGAMTGDGHYDAGFHATGTVGTFGAAAAAGHLLQLAPEAMERAFGLAAAQAAGLKSMFGTDAKPFHAGKAAVNGLLAAQLAAGGATAAAGSLEAPQGFFATQCPGAEAVLPGPRAEGRLAVTQTLFKYHAACYLTHSVIEAAARLRTEDGVRPEDIARLELHVADTLRSVCDLAAPETGLEVKFSVRHLAAMGLTGRDTAALDAYTADIARDPELVTLRERIELHPRPGGFDAAARVVARLVDGTVREVAHDVAIPTTDLDAREARLLAKARLLMAPVIGEERTEAALDQLSHLDGAASIEGLMEGLAAR
ncbi:MAG: MmgE/PrpD family protein [Pseudomonadota bacterium]